MDYILIIFSGVVILFLILIKKWFSGKSCHSKRLLTGKTAIVTGSNTGIGFETALDFAKRDARVIIACRNLHLGSKAADRIISLSSKYTTKIKREYQYWN